MMITLRVSGGWDQWLGPEIRGRLESEILPEYLPRQRWFASKARALERVRIIDASHHQPEAFPALTSILLTEVRYRDGRCETYLLPLGAFDDAHMTAAMRGRELARLDGPDGPRWLLDALADDATCRALVTAIAQGEALPTERGVIRAEPTAVFAEARGPVEAPLPVARSTAEQSNSAILYGDRLILKVFRRLEPGLNPDFEIGRFLSERARFDHVPRTAGGLLYERPGAEPISLAILQGLVRNRGTGWEHALASLANFYERAARSDGPVPSLPEGAFASPTSLAGPVAELMRANLDDAATLGQRTAEMHLALAGDPDDPDFAPEPLTARDLAALADAIQEQVDAALDALRDRLDQLSRSVQGSARRVLDQTPALSKRLERLSALTSTASKIRVHGDYHLGQVLRVNGDFVILDFEGEPAKPLAQRRAKHSPLKDVAGMLRSFDYAAFAGLFAWTAQHPDDLDRLTPWARAWQAWTSAAFLSRYLATASGAVFLPAERAHLTILLDAYTLDKALYELQYELNNRPDWVRIPLEGILALIK